MSQKLLLIALFVALGACSSTPKVAHLNDTVMPGSTVKKGTASIALFKGGLKQGAKLPKTILTDDKFQEIPMEANGVVRMISVVSSLDTKVCQLQTQELAAAEDINSAVERITVSRDLPMAQKRFAAEAKITNVKFLSDYKNGAFGRSTGLLMKGGELLAPAVIVVDGEGVVQHFQIVPDVNKLPNMARAIEIANKVAKK